MFILTSKYTWLDETLERIHLSAILKIIFALIICIGIVGNTINLMVFGNVKMRRTPVFRFLFYMSTIDLAILVMCGAETFFSMVFNIDLRVFHVFFCKFNSFLTYFLLQARNLLSMGITILSKHILVDFIEKDKKYRLC